MECSFQVGDEVVCVGQDAPDYAHSRDVDHTRGVVVGGVYTVSRVKAIPDHFPGAGRILLELAEFPTTPDRELFIAGYPHEWFSKVEKLKRSTNIEIFIEIDRRVFERVPVESFL